MRRHCRALVQRYTPVPGTPPDKRAIYTSIELGTCVLERLVHTPKDRIPSDLAVMKIHLSGSWVRTGRMAFDSPNALKPASPTGTFSWYPTLDDARARKRNITFELAIAVPSVVAPVWNVVLYPRAAGFWEHVSLASIEPFGYDPRLFPDETPPEDTNA